MKTYKLFIYTLVLALTACAPEQVTYKNIPISEPESGKPTVVIAHISGLEKPTYQKIGADDSLLSMGISSMATSGVQNKLKTLTVHNILHEAFYQDFKENLELKSYQVHQGLKLIDRKALRRPDNLTPAIAPYIFSSALNDSDAEYALVLDPSNFGLARTYYSFVPTSSPFAIADLNFFLVRLDDNAVMAHFKTRIESKADPDWDNGPDYSSLMQTIQGALRTALDRASTFLFDFEG